MAAIRLGFLIAALAGLLTFLRPAHAHPPVWVTMSYEIVFAKDGSATAIRAAWIYDEMSSVFAVQGVKGAQPDVFTRSELAPVAEGAWPGCGPTTFSSLCGPTARRER